MVRAGLLVVSVIVVAALCSTSVRADIRIGVAGPMTGVYAWAGDRYQRGVGLAVEDLNAKGGVLGQRVDLTVGDDFCDADQAVAVALAHKLATDGIVFVAGHWCSHASISAAKVYEQAKILMISPSSASAKLTDEGGPNVFRAYGRDDRQGAMVADYLVEQWAGKEIAILDDGTTWGTGVADGAQGAGCRSAASRRSWMRPSRQTNRSTPTWSPGCRLPASTYSFSAAITARRA